MPTEPDEIRDHGRIGSRTDRARRRTEIGITTEQADRAPDVAHAVAAGAAEGPVRARTGRRRTAARTRIIGWVLLLVLGALAAVTVLTWALLIEETDKRIDAALASEIEEFARVTDTGVNPTTGDPYDSVDEILRSVIAANLARPNEKFLGYLDGRFRWESRRQSPTVLLRADDRFTATAGSVRTTTRGSHPTAAGEVRWAALPVALAGDPRRGVIVVGYFTEQEHAFANEAARVMLLVGFGTALLAAGAAYLVAGRILRPLADVAATARTISGTDLSHRVPQRDGPTDEIAELAGTLNAMLDRVQSGMRSQRRFVDDAGHELRTPITIVRGHLDVVDPTDPSDVRETVELVDDELDRMNRLVSDMLSLTRAEQPSLLQIETVDVATFTRDLFGKLTRLAERDWRLEAVAAAHVRMDRQRITQAVVALADNATRHTSHRGRIALASEVEHGRLRLRVADDGPGVDPADRLRVFRRFARGEAGPRSGGAGLGLSIVEAIAGTHGGRVYLDSAPGHGATFVIEVPADGP